MTADTGVGPGGADGHRVRGSCHHDCPDTCMWEVTVFDGTAVSLRGDREHPTTRGELCPKVNRFLQRVYHPDRLRTPLRRTGPKGASEYEPVSWEDAIAEIARRVESIRRRYGGAAILQYSFDGTQGVIQKGLMADRFFDALGASDVRRHLCGVTAWLGAADVSGTPYGIDPEDLRHSRTIVLWGTNTYLTNRHIWPVIEEARDRGATIVNIDPIRTSTADRADVHLRIRPGTDVALVLGVIGVLDRDGLLDEAWLAEHTVGWPDLRESARALALVDVARITGVDVETIEWLAHLYATGKPAAIRVLVGPEHRENGREIMRAVAILPAVTGAWREIGGGLARSTQVYFESALAYPTARPARRRFDMAALGSVLNDRQLDPAIQALFVHNSNPAVICPDQGNVIRGLERDDLFTVVAEQFMTDTARYADIVLPATTQLEHLDLGIAWGHMYLSLNQPAIEPVGEALPNTEIFRRLAAALDLADPAFADTDEDMIRQLLDSTHPWLEGISYERLRTEGWARLAVPAGHRPNVDLAPDTDDGRLVLGALTHRPATESADGDPTLATRYPLTLLTRKQHLRFLNANYGGFEEHLPVGRRPFVQLHPDDAAARHIADGDSVRVFNDRGELSLDAVVSEEVQPGLVAIPFGWWHRHTPEGRGVNVLTNPAPAPGGEGSAAFHDTLVDVRPLHSPADAAQRQVR